MVYKKNCMNNDIPKKENHCDAATSTWYNATKSPPPKDGTPILVYTDDCGIYVVTCDEEYETQWWTIGSVDESFQLDEDIKYWAHIYIVPFLKG